MVITPQEQEQRAKKKQKTQVLVDFNVIETSFEKWSKPGHFSRTLAKGPKTTTWIWNLHADAHDFIFKQNHWKIFLVKFLVLILAN